MKKTNILMKVTTIASVILVCLFMTACKNSSQQTAATSGTTTESEVITSDTNESESSDSEAVITTETESSASESNHGNYTYSVGGVQVTLSTNIDDYIYTNSAGATLVDLQGIAESWGFYYPYDENDIPGMRQEWYFDTNGSYQAHILLGENVDHNYHIITASSVAGPDMNVYFTRNDISSNTTVYWIGNGGDGTGAYDKVNYEEIVIFTLIVENIANDTENSWVDSLGFSRQIPVTIQSIVNLHKRPLRLKWLFHAM